jgi:hypothetical protein
VRARGEAAPAERALGGDREALLAQQLGLLALDPLLRGDHRAAQRLELAPSPGRLLVGGRLGLERRDLLHEALELGAREAQLALERADGLPAVGEPAAHLVARRAAAEHREAALQGLVRALDPVDALAEQRDLLLARRELRAQRGRLGALREVRLGHRGGALRGGVRAVLRRGQLLLRALAAPLERGRFRVERGQRVLLLLLAHDDARGDPVGLRAALRDQIFLERGGLARVLELLAPLVEIALGDLEQQRRGGAPLGEGGEIAGLALRGCRLGLLAEAAPLLGEAARLLQRVRGLLGRDLEADEHQLGLALRRERGVVVGHAEGRLAGDLLADVAPAGGRELGALRGELVGAAQLLLVAVEHALEALEAPHARLRDRSRILREQADLGGHGGAARHDLFARRRGARPGVRRRLPRRVRHRRGGAEPCQEQSRRLAKHRSQHRAHGATWPARR